MLIGPEGLIEIDVVSVQGRAHVNWSDLLSVTIRLGGGTTWKGVIEDVRKIEIP